ncbi:MAG: hypothetical protein SCM96_12850 [Acidobacteriota bacterium]|nr:hypothetical protein [Acidobacteriota bacterium]
MKKEALILAVFLGAGLIWTLLSGQGPTPKIPTVQPWAGSRAEPAHVFPLRDDLDHLVVPTMPYPMPFSTRTSCGPCHDYNTVAGGFHFNAAASRPDTETASQARPAQPWFLVDNSTGTVLPVSHRGWKNTHHPDDLGLTDWEFTQLFARHLPGGGPSEPGEEGQDRASRWNVSGKIEINCLACHHASPRQDLSEWARQVMRENFRWAATAASGIAEVGGMASRMHGTWDVYDGPNPDDREWAIAPNVKYRAEVFDSRHYAFMDIRRSAGDRLCLACHSTAPAAAVRRPEIDRDVHAAAGLSCVDCHRNDLSHQIVRGYETEARDMGDPFRASLSCRGCHMGEDAAGKKTVTPGRLGAPWPQHKGIPTVHFRHLSCTVCHSGPKVDGGPEPVRTARANRLGIYGAALWHTDTPVIQEPVYMKGEDGKITPHRIVWPSFWGMLEGKSVTPIRPEKIRDVAGDVLDPDRRVGAILRALTPAVEPDEIPVLTAWGKILRADVDGRLVVVENESGITARTGAGTDRTAGKPESAGQAAVTPVWGVMKNGAVEPIVPAVDPEADPNEAAYELAPRFQAVLEALRIVGWAPGQPALVYGGTTYKLTDGFLDMVVPEEDADSETAADSGPALGWLAEDGTLLPLVSDFDLKNAVQVAGLEQALTEEQVAAILARLAEPGSATASGESPSDPGTAAVSDGAGKPTGEPVKSEETRTPEDGAGGNPNPDPKAAPAQQTGEPVYISGGRLFRLDTEGRLKASRHDAAEPAFWPAAHDVRPAQQALGWNGCGDCHSAGSSFFFAKVEGAGPLLTDKIERRRQSAFMGLGGLFQRIFGLTFAVRPTLKFVLFAAGLLIAGILLAAALIFLGRATGLAAREKG